MIPLHEMIAKARLLGIDNAEVMARADLIRAIQRAEGNSPCFGSEWCKPEYRETCMWKDECGAKVYSG